MTTYAKDPKINEIDNRMTFGDYYPSRDGDEEMYSCSDCGQEFPESALGEELVRDQGTRVCRDCLAVRRGPDE